MGRGRISQSFITKLLGMVDIVQIMQMHGIELKKSGRAEYKACCPFHSERTPSFYVSQDKQLYNCFGCKASGNIVTFLMEYNKYSFPDAIEYLAELAGIPVERDNDDGNTDSSINYSEYYSKMRECSELYARVLKDSSLPQGISYLQNRGITIETIDRFKLGYAPPGWQFLTKYLVKDPQTDLKLLSDLGMIIHKENGGNFYDAFRDRVMIPILDRRGRVVAFGGRVLNDDKPKYLNSPEMVIFHKGRELFGLYQAIEYSKQNQGNLPYLVIVEGYMDVIALAQAGFNYAVASLGTSTTTDQFEMMFRYTKKVICCYDGDAAGQKAAWHALQTMLPSLKDDCDVRFAFLPVEHDPDSYVREFGLTGFESYLEKAKPLDEYLFEHLKNNLVSENSRRELANNALDVLATMPNNLRFDELIRKLATISFQDSTTLMKECSARKSLRARTNYSRQPQQEEKEMEITPIRRAYALSIQYPKSVIAGKDTIAYLLRILGELGNIKGVKEYQQIFNFIVEYPNRSEISVNTACILSASKGTNIEKWVTRLARADIYGHADNIKTENVTADITATLSKLVLEHYEQRVSKLQNESMKRELSDDELKELSDKVKYIKKFSGRTITADNTDF